MTAYVAPQGLESELKDELGEGTVQYGRLFFKEGPYQKAFWAQNTWLNAQKISFTSIQDAVRKLKNLNRLWCFHPYQSIRRGHLIASQLPYFSPKPLVFGAKLPSIPLGSWTLIDDHTLLAAPQCTSVFADGEVKFIESSIPPSRAYLKLWELFTLLQKAPMRNETCLELGASPGSWTWVLQQLAGRVIAIDRAPLNEAIQKMPNVEFQKRDAFSIQSSELEGVHWLFSDVICFPEKLYQFIQKHLHLPIYFVCTIKFQGSADKKIIDQFAKIERSSIIHLSNNKHELTWIRESLGNSISRISVDF